MKKKIIVISTAIILVLGITAALFYNGILLFNYPSKEKYPVRGVDVSSYQGEIDWKVLAGQGIDFAFIKATEGSSFVDKRFQYNYEHAKDTDLLVGAYHFFSFDSSGTTQAENFCKTVPNEKTTLPPVVDIEFYGDKEKNPPEACTVQKELKALLDCLEEHYGKKPILYATKPSYDRYLANEFQDYKIWIRDIFKKPTLSDGKKWTFWQYTNRKRLQGYQGAEKYIDMNVFDGTKEELASY